jgi:hypothetical protein
VAWIFMHELWSVRKSDVIVHEKEGCWGIKCQLSLFSQRRMHFFFVMVGVWMVNDGLQCQCVSRCKYKKLFMGNLEKLSRYIG